MSEHYLNMNRRTFIGGLAFASAACATGFAPELAFAEPTAAEKQAEAAAVLDSLNAMQTKLDLASDNYFQAVSAQQEAQQKMDEAQARIDEASQQISSLQDQLGTRAQSMYTSGSSTFIDLLLGATSFKAFTNNWDLLNDLNDKDAQMVQETKDLRAEIQQQRDEYAEQERIAAEQAEQARQIQAEAQSVVNEIQATYNSLSAEAAELLAKEEAARQAAEAAAAEAAIRQQQQQASAAQSTPAASNGSTQSSTSNSSSSTKRAEPAYVPSTGNAIVDRARSWVGRAEYVWAACEPGAFDCSGFVSYCVSGAYSRMGSSSDMMGWPRVSDPQPGDVAVRAGHVGIYIGGGQMIHAVSPGQGVQVGSVMSGMYFVRP